jgi:hypothetical protein
LLYDNIFYLVIYCVALDVLAEEAVHG